MARAQNRQSLSPLEHRVMRIVWREGACHADLVRRRLRPTDDLKDSTVRTVLRRLEAKGFVEHTVVGRTYMYRASVAQRSAAVSELRRLVERFFGGSLEELLTGLVDDRVLSAAELEELAAKVVRAAKEREERHA